MKTVLIVAAGERASGDFLKLLASSADFVIGVDRGAEDLLALKIPLDVAIGDFDSASNIKSLEKVKKIKFPKNKDFSDTELAVNYAIEKGFDSFILTQMLGKRTDHLLFNIAMMRKLLRKGKTCCIKEEKEEIYIMDKEMEIKVKKGDIISLFPLTSNVYSVSSFGLKYELNERNLSAESSLSLSNRAVKEKVKINVKKGTILVIVEKIYKVL
ncbi:MAG: thiamine diphosphokinase [Fervidobacterium sp.]